MESLFNKDASPQPAGLLKKRFQHRCFPEIFEKFLKHLFIEHLGVTASDSTSQANKTMNKAKI